MEIIKLIIIFIGGIAGGLYGSTVGGGALISLPLLVLVGLPTHIALGTQRLAAVMLELASAIKFHRAGKLNFTLAFPLGIVAAVGSIIGVSLVFQPK